MEGEERERAAAREEIWPLGGIEVGGVRERAEGASDSGSSVRA